MNKPFILLATLTLSLLISPCLAQQAAPAQCSNKGSFNKLSPVTVSGYDDILMEPFLSPDGNTLFFNNSNNPAEKTDMHWARRENDTTFTYGGLLTSANSTSLDGVASLSDTQRFCFVSLRNYGEKFDAFYCGQWDGAEVSNIKPISSISRHKIKSINFDGEISRDGQTLYYEDGVIGWTGLPAKAQIRIATAEGDDFKPRPELNNITKSINKIGVVYAPAVSPDGCEMIFTSMEGLFPFYRLSMYRATRTTPDGMFGRPERIRIIPKNAEAATFTPDGRSIYFHMETEKGYRLFRLDR